MDVKLTLKEFAEKLDGREYKSEIYQIEESLAKELGFVVVFGYSDDNMVLRGAINDEIGCYNGGVCYLTCEGLLDICDCECKHFEKAKKDCVTITAVWNDFEGDYAWTYETEIPHETFDIVDDEGLKYCQGIVFDINNLG